MYVITDIRHISPGPRGGQVGALTDHRRMEEAVMAQHRAPHRSVGIWIAITVLLAASLIGTLWVPFYNHLTPTHMGFPFFYWYQLMWVPIVAILAAVAYLLSWLARRNNATASAESPDRGQREAD
jgi:hypothetical protein